MLRPFAVVSRALLKDERLTSEEKVLYALVCLDLKEGSSVVDVDLEKLSDVLFRSPVDVTSNLSRLVFAGYLRQEPLGAYSVTDAAEQSRHAMSPGARNAEWTPRSV